MLGNCTRLFRGKVALTQGIDQASLTMVNVTHKCDNWWSGNEILRIGGLNLINNASVCDIQAIFFGCINRYFATKIGTNKLHNGLIIEHVVQHALNAVSKQFRNHFDRFELHLCS